jgi:hypothetical protein
MKVTEEQSKGVRRELWLNHPHFACEVAVWECAEILHAHMALPIPLVEWELGAAADLMLAGDHIGRTAKSQWLAGAADGVGLVTVRLELEDAINDFCARLSVDVVPSLILRAWAEIVDPAWDERVCRPTVHTFANVLPERAKHALKRFKNKPYENFIK